MNSPSNFDRETFQQLLANAYAVQESQISARSLADIMEVQRSVASGKLDLDGAMTHIVESARTVANADGVAIALFNKNHLTYRAASGSSAAHIGVQVTASLTVSANSRTNREILRVENAQTDGRIEADICRQFGANSLLILPIYLDTAIAGVLDVRFSEAHAFQEREIRTYRLMAEEIEAALLCAANPKQQEQQENAAELPPIAQAFEQIYPPEENLVVLGENFASPIHENLSPSPDENFVPPPEFMMLPQNANSLYARCEALIRDVLQLPGFKRAGALGTMLTRRTKSVTRPPSLRIPCADAPRESKISRLVLLKTTLLQRARTLTQSNRWQNLSAGWRNRAIAARRSLWSSSIAARRELRYLSIAAAREFHHSASQAAMLARRAKNLGWLSERRRVALEAVVAVLALAALIVYRDRGPAKSEQSSTLPSSMTADLPHPPKPLAGKWGPSAQPGPSPSQETAHAKTTLRRVRVNRDEVDYVADDVTMRVFTNKPAAKPPRASNARVAKYGDDVTVRYFTPAPASTRTASR